MKSALLSEYLGGRNLGCYLLYNNGSLIKYGCLERKNYLMSKVAVSGITGNTSEGKLINCNKAIEVADKAVMKIAEYTSETMEGLVVVDCKEDAKDTPYVTEINIRHNALTCIFAMAGLNFAESHLLLIAGKKEKISPYRTMSFPPNNLFLRDVDGYPLYMPDSTRRV